MSLDDDYLYNLLFDNKDLPEDDDDDPNFEFVDNDAANEFKAEEPCNRRLKGTVVPEKLLGKNNNKWSSKESKKLGEQH